MAVSRFTRGPGADTRPRGNSGRGGVEGGRKRPKMAGNMPEQIGKISETCWKNVGTLSEKCQKRVRQMLGKGQKHVRPEISGKMLAKCWTRVWKMAGNSGTCRNMLETCRPNHRKASSKTSKTGQPTHQNKSIRSSTNADENH